MYQTYVVEFLGWKTKQLCLDDAIKVAADMPAAYGAKVVPWKLPELRGIRKGPRLEPEAFLA